MGKLLQLAIYNPSVINDEDFLRGFVARNREAGYILKALKENIGRGPSSHQLILGQRGMGKSTMLRRISLGIEDDPELREKFIPLSFREEQYNVHNLATFWHNCVDSLGDWFDRAGLKSQSDELDKFILRTGNDDKDYYQYFIDALKKEGKRPILLIDNIDLVIDALPTAESWAFRRVLQEPSGIVVIGAATAYMEAFSDQNRPFFDFFQVIVLERLKPAELMNCLGRLASLRGDAGQAVLNIIENDPGRIRALFELTGGNPRTLTLLYVLLESNDMGDVFSDLESLLDQVTGLYKSRVEDLASQARLVLDALALQWNPCTAAEIANLTGLATNKVSVQLDRMTNDGLVERARRSDSKKLAYQIAERFFNIWYLMRHAPRRQRLRLRWLVSFLQVFYSTKQLTDKAVSLLKDATDEHADLLFAVGGAIGDPAWQKLIAMEANGASDFVQAQDEATTEVAPTTSAEWMSHGKNLSDHLGRHEDAVVAFKNAAEDPSFLAEANWRIGNIYQFAISDLEKARKHYEIAVDADESYSLANYSLGALLANSSDWKSAAKFLKASTKDTKTNFSAQMALGGFYQYREHDESLAETHYRRAVKAGMNNVNALAALGNMLIDVPGKVDEGISYLKKARKAAPDWGYPAWRLGYATFFTKRNFDHGLKLLREAKELDPSNIFIKRSLCEALALVPQRWDEAKAALEDLVETDDRLLSRAMFAEFLLAAFGDVEAAYIEFQKVLDGNPQTTVDFCARAFTKMYYFEDIIGAKADYEEAQAVSVGERRSARDMENDDLVIKSNLLIISLAIDTRSNNLQDIYDSVIERHSPTGRNLIDAILKLSNDNFGDSFGHFRNALQLNSFELYETYKGFLIFYLRLVERAGYGDRLLNGLQEDGLADKYWPVYSALDAYFNGEDKLLDVNPEVRGAASMIFHSLLGIKRMKT